MKSDQNPTQSAFLISMSAESLAHESTNEAAESKMNRVGGLNVFQLVEENSNSSNLWDEAYAMKQKYGNSIDLIEPVLDNENPYKLKDEEGFESFHKESKEGFDEDWAPENNQYQNQSKIWHLSNAHSQLGEAMSMVTSQYSNQVRIAHFDTGIDRDHEIFLEELIENDLQRNFVKGKGEDPQDATDRTTKGGLRQPKHGKGTLTVLAGGPMKNMQHGHEGPIGLTKNVKVVPVRLANSVILLKTSAFVEALNYIIDLYDDERTRVHIITMSMGGLASKAWAEAVNRAYEKGIFIVTAAGNNYGNLPTRVTIYPARFNRVVAALGVTHDYKPYYKAMLSDPTEMQGNHGPRRVMNYAMGAFTPNMPWAKAEDTAKVSLQGAGTSCATPQIAIAAALYLMKNFDEISALPHGWQRVEAIRHALFHSARKNHELPQEVRMASEDDFKLYFGQGILRAKALLDVPVDASLLEMAPKDKVQNPLWNLLNQINLEADFPEEMLNLELQQLLMQDPVLQELTHYEEVGFDSLSVADQKAFLDRLIQMEKSSQTMRAFAKYRLGLYP